MKICAHTLVKNEERYVWFAVMSVINYVDEIKLWDTGSTDNTYKILQHIKSLYPEKVDLRQEGDVDPNKFTQVRQQMLDETNADWVIIVDGDEVWWDQSISKIRTEIANNGKHLETIVTYYRNVIGDIYHYQDESAGRYSIDGIVGNLTPRALNRNIPGLHLDKPHGTQGFFDKDGVLIYERDSKKRIHHPEIGYLHFTFMPRAGNRKNDLEVSKRGFKLKYEIGNSFPLDYYYPEVFFKTKPDFVPNPWVKMSQEYKLKAVLQTYPKKLKRKIYHGKTGY